jgi:hypothetical protein
MKKLNRRDFLKRGSAIALLPAAAPSLLVGKKTEKPIPATAPEVLKFKGVGLKYKNELRWGYISPSEVGRVHGLQDMLASAAKDRAKYKALSINHQL